MAPVIRDACWLLAALASPASAALRTTSDCSPIRMPPLAQADIRMAPDIREEPQRPPVPANDIRIAPGDPQALRLPSDDDARVRTDLNRLRARATAVLPTNRKARPAVRASTADAAWTLGLIHLHGAGVTQDAVAAKHWFETASRFGHPKAAAGLAWCETDGCGAPGNPVAARVWLRRLEKTQPGKAAYLEWLLLSKTSPMESPASLRADGRGADPQDLLERAARSGDVQAHNELGLALAYAMQLEAALAHFRQAAPQSPAASANAKTIEKLLDHDRPVDAPVSRATQRLIEAQRHHRGDGVPGNYNEAIRLYREAESLGSAEAGRMLALIFSRPPTDGTINVGWMRQLAWMDLSESIPRAGSPATGTALQRDATPLYEWLPPIWQTRALTVRPR